MQITHKKGCFNLDISYKINHFFPLNVKWLELSFSLTFVSTTTCC